MNKNPFFSLFLLLSVILLSAEAQASTIAVSTVAEFLGALGSDRTIILQPGDYDLSQADSANGAFYRWENGFAKQELHIIGAHHLSIQSTHGKEAILLSSMSCGQVIVFEDCGNLSLKDLKITHSDHKPDCQGGALHFVDCNDLLLSNLKIRSERRGGVQLRSCNNVRFEKVFIEHAHASILQIDECNLAMFARCKFAANEGPALVEVRNSSTVQFHACFFFGNISEADSIPSYIYYVDQSSDVGVFRGVLMNNEADYLSNSSSTPTFDKVQLKDDNHWRIAKFAD